MPHTMGHETVHSELHRLPQRLHADDCTLSTDGRQAR
jgi:hypothetical protein